MKKVILGLAFVLAVSSSAVNASSSDEIIPTTPTENIEVFEEPSCLIIAYNQVEALEYYFMRRLEFEDWKQIYKVLFDACNKAQTLS